MRIALGTTPPQSRKDGATAPPQGGAKRAMRRHAELRITNAVYERVSEASRRTVVRIRPARFFGIASVLSMSPVATSRLRALVPPFDAIKNVRAGQNDAGPQFFIFNFSL